MTGVMQHQPGRPSKLMIDLFAGEWYMEFHRLLTAHDVLEERGPSLPADMAQGHELLKVLQREHCR